VVELTWEGKYTADGKRTAPLRIQLAFQTAETVNESAQERQMALDLFSAGRPPTVELESDFTIHGNTAGTSVRWRRR